ncbi:MAG: sugar O-acetyltransferase [Ruminococcaceae bacterium]|nr:sugar O-acetyltransferase [Oscillospiraceae bacterium]
MDIHEKMHSGEWYLPNDPVLAREQAECLEKLYDYNATRPHETEKRAALLRDMFAEIGEGCYFEPPFHANWAGKFMHFGKNIYCNFGVTFVDDTSIYVGDFTQFGPHCVIATADHPLDDAEREAGYQRNFPVRIGRNCWFGAGVLVMPGVTIGNNVVVGAGSVVTHDLPDNVLAHGVPCRVVREL